MSATDFSAGTEAGVVLPSRVALVTGASRGIGAATAKHLARAGAAVCVNFHRNADAAEQVVKAITASGGKAISFQADVEDEEQVRGMVSQVEAQLGAIDILVLNASATGNVPPSPLLEQQLPHIERHLQAQLRALFHPCQAVVPSMRERRKGCIIAVSSNWSRSAFENFGLVSLAKSQVDAFIRSLALELGPQGIRVNAIAPSLVLTDLNNRMPQARKDGIAERTPLRRNAMPEDIARAVVLLASEYADFITGVYLPVSGGSQML